MAAVWSEPAHTADCRCRECRDADAAAQDAHEALLTLIEIIEEGKPC